jgi:hypothetical protein
MAANPTVPADLPSLFQWNESTSLSYKFWLFPSMGMGAIIWQVSLGLAHCMLFWLSA